eukprot:Skav209932  [mRNA]  locus=scaffold102:48475:65886:+ [translate_table: standard]
MVSKIICRDLALSCSLLDPAKCFPEQSGWMLEACALQGPPVRGYIDGCFDIMHSGHYNAIRQAKNICDVLVVGIHSDQEIAENKSMPVMEQAERYRLLDHIKWIDEILYDVPYSPEIATLERARADFCIHGDDMPVNSQGFCAYDEMRNAGRLRIIKRTEGVSTTDLIGRLLTLSRNQPTDLGGSPTMGVRMSADEVIEQAEADDRGDEVKLLKEMTESVQKLVEKYRISGQDAAVLQDQMSQIQSYVLRPQSPSGYLPSVPTAVPSSRTQVPVQLLASTRRIREFSSAKQPTPDDCVVYVSGSFDMFHVGHAEFLKDARELGTFLLVGIHDDANISKAKGQNLPVMNLNERFEVPKKSGIYKELPSRWPDLCHDTVVERIIRGREQYLTRNKDRARREDDRYICLQLQAPRRTAGLAASCIRRKCCSAASSGPILRFSQRAMMVILHVMAVLVMPAVAEIEMVEPSSSCWDASDVSPALL